MWDSCRGRSLAMSIQLRIGAPGAILRTHETRPRGWCRGRVSVSLRESGQLRPEYACRPLKNTFTIVKLKITAEKPTIASHAEGLPRQPRVARAWM